MRDPHRDGFNRLVVDPDSLPREALVEVLRGAAGQLQALDAPELRWLGRVLGDVLREGDSLDARLRLRPQRGSHNTTRALARRAEVDSALLRLSAAVGVARASRILRGAEPTPAAQADLVERLRCMRAPTSVAAFTRARRAARDRR